MRELLLRVREALAFAAVIALLLFGTLICRIFGIKLDE